MYISKYNFSSLMKNLSSFIVLITILFGLYLLYDITESFRFDYGEYGKIVDPVTMLKIPICSTRGRQLMRKYMQCYFNEYLYKTKNDWNYILPTTLYRELSKGNPENYFLIDVRKPEDYRNGHIPGATNIYWLDLMKPENLEKLPKDRDIIIICYVGHTASQTLVLLKMLGYRAKVLKFGMGTSPQPEIPVKGWVNYKYTLETI